MDNRYDVLLQALFAAFGSQLKTVVLFGSRARGDALPDSDHDIFYCCGGSAARSFRPRQESAWNPVEMSGGSARRDQYARQDPFGIRSGFDAALPRCLCGRHLPVRRRLFRAPTA
ncbi:MAG TPA: nucleotidyltransferase domain-containing protein [Acidobacteriota bacterium]|nr:nucleotidyltransferase domain-containing protein [Acidobacteriota bacterium]